MTRVYVGGLPMDVRERDVEDLFYKFGRYKYIDIKNQGRPPAFAFVEYEDPRDASEAVRRRDGIDFMGTRLRVEIAKGAGGPGGGGGGGGYRDRDSGLGGGARSNFRPPASKGFRVTVKGLPKGASWQDLKDHVRMACKPSYTDVRVDRNGDTFGIVEFDTYEDMKLAIRKLDDTEFKNPRYDRGHYVRFIEEESEHGGGGGGGRDRGDRDQDRDRDRSRSRSPRRRADSPERERDRSRGGREDRDHAKDEDEDRPRDDDAPARGDADRARARSASRSRSRSY